MRRRNYKKNHIAIWGQNIKIAQILILTVEIAKNSLDDFSSRMEKIEEGNVEET